MGIWIDEKERIMENLKYWEILSAFCEYLSDDLIMLVLRTKMIEKGDYDDIIADFLLKYGELKKA